MQNTAVAPTPEAISILLAESQRIYIEGLRSVFASNSDLTIVGVVSSFEAMQRLVIDKRPSIVILDEVLLARRPNQLQWMATTYPTTKIIVSVNSEDRDFTLGLLHSGARAVVPKLVAPPELVKRIRAVARGSYSISSTVQAWLIDDWHISRKALGMRTLPIFTERENIIVRMVLAGHKNNDIAIELKTTEQVIKNILNRLYKKLQVKDRATFRTTLRTLGVTTAA